MFIYFQGRAVKLPGSKIYELMGILTIIAMKPKDLMVNLISAKHKCGSGPDPHPVRDAQMMDERNHQTYWGKGFVSQKARWWFKIFFIFTPISGRFPV